jgi:hypothetical protein
MNFINVKWDFTLTVNMTFPLELQAQKEQLSSEFWGFHSHVAENSVLGYDVTPLANHNPTF